MDNKTSSGISYSDEQIVWEGSPSQWTNITTFLWWGGMLSVALAVLLLWHNGLQEQFIHETQAYVSWGCCIVIAQSIATILYAYFSVRCELTTITKNKIKESKGITKIFRRDMYCEISDIKDIRSPPAGLMGLVGLSTLVIETNDEDQPLIEIRAIRDRDSLVDLILPLWRNLKVDRKGYFGD